MVGKPGNIVLEHYRGLGILERNKRMLGDANCNDEKARKLYDIYNTQYTWN